MTPGLEYALGAMLFYGLVDFIYKRAAAAGVHARHFMMVQAWCFAPTITLYGLATRTLHPGIGMLWGMGAGLLIFVALYNFARSLAGGAVSINAPIFRLSFAITAALAVLLLGEPITAWKLSGLVGALAAVWLLLGARQSGARHNESASSLVRVLVATVAMGIVNLFYKLGTLAGGSSATVLVGQASIFITLATGFAWAADRRIRPPRTTWSYAPIAAVLLFFAGVTLIKGLERGEASVLVPIAQMSFVVTTALGLAFLRERFTARSAIGIAFAATALALLAKS